MAKCYSVDDVLVCVEIPAPEEKDMSEDEFDGYIDQENDKHEDACDEEEMIGDIGDIDGAERDGIPQLLQDRVAVHKI